MNTYLKKTEKWWQFFFSMSCEYTKIDWLNYFVLWQIPLQSKKTWISDKSAYSFCSLLTENLACTDLSPVVLMKALKNSTEIAGKWAH